jgi:hypothetical protein
METAGALRFISLWPGRLRLGNGGAGARGHTLQLPPFRNPSKTTGQVVTWNVNPNAKIASHAEAAIAAVRQQVCALLARPLKCPLARSLAGECKRRAGCRFFATSVTRG